MLRWHWLVNVTHQLQYIKCVRVFSRYSHFQKSSIRNISYKRLQKTLSNTFVISIQRLQAKTLETFSQAAIPTDFLSFVCHSDIMTLTQMNPEKMSSFYGMEGGIISVYIFEQFWVIYFHFAGFFMFFLWRLHELFPQWHKDLKKSEWWSKFESFLLIFRHQQDSAIHEVILSFIGFFTGIPHQFPQASASVLLPCHKAVDDGVLLIQSHKTTMTWKDTVFEIKIVAAAPFTASRKKTFCFIHKKVRWSQIFVCNLLSVDISWHERKNQKPECLLDKKWNCIWCCWGWSGVQADRVDRQMGRQKSEWLEECRGMEKLEVTIFGENLENTQPQIRHPQKIMHPANSQLQHALRAKSCQTHEQQALTAAS